jgi:hypothetical protein
MGHSGWWLGAIFGFVHCLFSGTALVDTCSADPSAHGHPSTFAPSVALIEPPAS